MVAGVQKARMSVTASISDSPRVLGHKGGKALSSKGRSSEEADKSLGLGQPEQQPGLSCRSLALG